MSIKAEFKMNQSQAEAMKRKLNAARTTMRESSSMFKQVAIFLDQWVQKNFQTAGGKAGGWAPFMYGGRLVRKAKSNAYNQTAKRYINTSARLMMNTGRLRLSFMPYAKIGQAGIGSDLPYSKPHDYGDNAIQRKLLPREENVKVDVREIMTNFIMVRIDRA